MPTLTQKRLKKLLNYNHGTGVFTWKHSVNHVKIGFKAGSKTTGGYIGIKVDGVLLMAHRLAFMYMKGYFPEHEVDHMNGVRCDNRWKNLRHVTKSCNLQNQKIRANNKSGFNGVCRKGAELWRAYVMINGKYVCLGTHVDIESAALARVAWEESCENWECDYRSENRKRLREKGYSV